MSDSASQPLPLRPSLAQIRKRAKELLRDFRGGDKAAAERIGRVIPRLADPELAEDVGLAEAQFVLAREYGFESWPKLLHELNAMSAVDLEQHERLARDLVTAYQSGDGHAIHRLNELFHSSYDWGQVRESVQRRLRALPDSERRIAEFALADAQLLIAQLYGFESWEKFLESCAQPESDSLAAPFGMSTRPPFYKIDLDRGMIEPRQPMSAKDWDRIIGVMKEMCLTGLDAKGQISDDVVEKLSRLDCVTSLRLGGCQRLSDDGLLFLARMPQLVELDLSEHPGGRLTDRGLQVLRHLPALRRFQMCWQRGISDAGIANLARCDSLERVDLLGSPTGDGAINALRGKARLRHFKTGRLVTDAGLSLLHEFPVFKTWQAAPARFDLMTFGDAEPNFLMLDGPFSDAGLAGLNGLDGVFGLGFFWHVSELTPNGLKPLARLPNLGALGCDGNLCDDTAMRHIAAIPQLRMLMAQGTVATDDGFAALSKSRTIEYIWGRECPNLRGPGFRALAEMPALKGVAVSCKLVDDASLALLPRFPALAWLLPMDVTDDGFRHVGGCSQLEKLTCMYCRDTGDIATEHIAGLTRLKHYYAGNTRITDRSLEILGGMTSLEEVELSACSGITDAGLAHLARLPRLKKLSVDATPRVTRAGIAVFHSNVRVNFWI